MTSKQTKNWKPGRPLFRSSTLIWKNTSLIWSISVRLCDVKGVHLHIIISCVPSCYFGSPNGSELRFSDFLKTWPSICKCMREWETLAQTYIELIKIINYINFLVFWTIDYEKTFNSIWHSNVSIPKTQNCCIIINWFYFYISISFATFITWQTALGLASSLLH